MRAQLPDDAHSPRPGAAAPGLLAKVRPYTGLVALAALCTLFGVTRPAFFSTDNFFNILNAVAIFGILAVGQAFPLIGGGFDLSQGAVAGLSGAVTASLLSRYGQPIPVAVAAGLTAGMLLGAVNGALIARIGVNPFVATLGTQISFFGLTNVYTNNQPLSLGPASDQFRRLANTQESPLTYAALLFLGLVLLLWLVLRLLPFGQHVYTLGGNEEATRLAGVNTVGVKSATYVLSGLLAAVAGMVIIARSGQASPSAGQGYELESIASCIIGGIALGGGVGGAGNVFLGAVTLAVIDNGLQMVGDVISPNWRLVIRGVIILLAVTVDARARLRT
jgi:ribose transport system permease protein